MKLPLSCPSKTVPFLPPAGLWFETEAGAKSPYLARWREGEKKKSKRFTSEKDRVEFAKLWAKRREMYGQAVQLLTPKDAEYLAEFSRITGGADLLQVAREWVAARGAPRSISLEDAIKRWLESDFRRTLSRDTITHRDLHLKRFAAVFSGRAMDSITEAELRSWIYGMRINGDAVSVKTQIHHYATIARLFDYCHKARVISANPFALIPRPDDTKHEDVAILSIRQAQDLFEENKGALCVARLALEAFGGLRYTSASRIEFSDIRTESKGIVFPAPKHKLGKRFYVEGWPDNLWAWIEAAPSACWQVSARQYLELKREMFESAGLKGEGYGGELRNVLRHSFASYHVAKHGDAAKTAILLTHRNPSMLYSHYMGVATKADAEVYFSIVP